MYKGSAQRRHDRAAKDFLRFQSDGRSCIRGNSFGIVTP
jgi:hypothetical protein